AGPRGCASELARGLRSGWPNGGSVAPQADGPGGCRQHDGLRLALSLARDRADCQGRQRLCIRHARPCPPAKEPAKEPAEDEEQCIGFDQAPLTAINGAACRNNGFDAARKTNSSRLGLARWGDKFSTSGAGLGTNAAGRTSER